MGLMSFPSLWRFVGALLLPISGAQAGIVDYTATSLGGNIWRYDYTINNTTPGTAFDELTIYFDVNNYGLLSSPTAPIEWDPLLIQPDTAIPADGFFDVINLAGTLADADTVSGFSVTFNFHGQGTPGSQSFALLDSTSFRTILEGRTSLAGAAVPVPEPDALVLAFTALLAAMGAHRTKRYRVNRMVF